jgi:hypothetical protein
MKALSSLVILFCLAMTATAQDNTVKMAMDKFDAFHDIMHPAWHEAYPSKDYQAILASGPKFEEAFAQIMPIDPKIPNSARYTRYASLRKIMSDRVVEFAAACKAKDEQTAYKLLPDLHNAFEDAMAALYPFEFKPVDGILVTVDVILDMHIPSENWDGMAGSTETILMKLDHITDSSYTPEVAPYLDRMKADFANAGILARARRVRAVDDLPLTGLVDRAIPDFQIHRFFRLSRPGGRPRGEETTPARRVWG